MRYNYRNNGATAIALADSGAAAANQLYLGSPPLLEAGNGGALANTNTNATLALGAPAGRAARPGLALGSADTGLFQPASGALAATAGGAELLRASAGAMTLGAAPGGHALEVATPPAGANRLVVTGGGTGSGGRASRRGRRCEYRPGVTGKGSGPGPHGDGLAAADNSSRAGHHCLGAGAGLFHGVRRRRCRRGQQRRRPHRRCRADHRRYRRLRHARRRHWSRGRASPARLSRLRRRQRRRRWSSPTGTVTLTTADIGGFASGGGGAGVGGRPTGMSR